uniref:disease resistance protein RPV1-like isoform X2 n=1 Tax=Erigeron canadensis TaxID=72917 RepID=UPI001CB91F9E|nr:disease resistance protein RPV1-like isoform X2 [Erigeron canadensis]
MVILSEIEKGSSSSSHSHDHDHKNHKQQRYDVFLSFRGADTRNSFSAHLYDALVNAKIDTFLDDEEIETGEDLKPELQDAIRSSRASVIVLSENYATSTWCLDELVLILEQRETSDHMVIPIFYHVEPTNVRMQQKSFGDAMAEHRHQKMEAETNAEKRVNWGEKIDRWCKALTQVANLKGEDIIGRREPDMIEEIVTKIRQRLGVPLSGTLPLLIGRNHHIEEITSWLTDDSSRHTVDILTVFGMGGIGKTSLAKNVFHFYSRTFAKSCFLEGINLRCTEKFDGLLDVQKQLCDVILEKDKLQVKVFLVLDDIDSLEQLDALLGSKSFHPGSKILITTRDASLTERCALFKSEVEHNHTTFKVEGLYDTAALKLLCLHAFNSNDPKEGYGEVIKKLMKYCEGHPLAIQVLGKSLYNRDITYWEECIETLKNESRSDIRTVLQMSFDSLPSFNDKELFKHIACFFVGINREISEKILKACDINTKSGITNLIERCLLSIDQRDNCLKMHQLLQEMGKAIVREESPHHPGKRSRLWCHDESFKVLKGRKGTDRVKGLVLDTRMLEKEKFCALKTDAFSNMDNLMILQLNYVQLSGSYEHFPEELRWLRLHGFPMKSIPSDIPMEKLVVLNMSNSKIESFAACCTSCNPQPIEAGQKLIGSCSKDKRILGSLKILDLSFCSQLHEFGGFYELPALEALIVKKCIRLIEICKSFEECAELVHIDLRDCVKLEKLPTAIHKLKKVETLLLDGCNISSLVEKIQSDLNFCAISIPSSLVRLSLKNNNLSNESFPVDLSCLSSLKYLWLDKNPIVSMPNCIRSLCSLEILSMVNCKTLMSVEHPPCTLKRLDVRMSSLDSNKILQKISFDLDMSPINIVVSSCSFRPWSYEIEGMVKIQALESVEEKVLCSLGWTNLFDFLNKRHVRTYHLGSGVEQSHIIQMYYEFGIFSTIYGGQGMMPDWISWSISCKETPVSFTIPSSPKKQLRGLNLCYMLSDISYITEAYTSGYKNINDRFFKLPTIEISNKTKNRTWGYKHCVHETYVGGEWLTYLSHWMFGMNELEAGDQIIITLKGEEYYAGSKKDDGCAYVSQITIPLKGEEYDDGRMKDDGCEYVSDHVTEKFGAGFVYEDEDGMMEDEEEDALEYYKSWNHIIGGDLSCFQVTSGEYVLFHEAFTRVFEMGPLGYCGYSPSEYKEKIVHFRAFSKTKSPKTLRKRKVMEIVANRPPLGLQGVLPRQAHPLPLRGASTSKLHILDDDDDDDDCLMIENEEKEKKESLVIKKRSCWWKMVSWCQKK